MHDYAQAKLAFDAIIDPAQDRSGVLEQVEGLSEHAERFAGSNPTVEAALAALGKVLHESGPWNDGRPFAYDQSDPLGQRLQNALLSSYLATRLGQCVSMPILYLVLAERIGLNATLACAPCHLFVRVTLADGRAINIETTSGARPARTEWFRQEFAISDRSIKSGIYMRSLSRRECIAAMAGTVTQHLVEMRRHAEAAEVARVMLTHDPLSIHALLTLGSACGHMLKHEFTDRYSSPFLIPPLLRPRWWMLAETNRSTFAQAEALGWEPHSGCEVQSM